MILKSPQKKVRCIDETVLGNKILIVGFRLQGGFESFGYTITLQAVLDYVRSTREVIPETVDELVIEYAKDEYRLCAADRVEVYADQVEADRMDELYCNESNSITNQQSDEWLIPMIIGSYLNRFYKDLPEEAVCYLH